MTINGASPRSCNPQATQKGNEPNHREYLTTFRASVSSSFFDVALSWLGLGVAVIPIAAGGKSPVVKWQRYTSKLPTPNDARRWWGSGQRFNLAVVCGWQGLTVLDFDASESYRKWRLDHPGASESYTVKTARGYHVYLFADDARSFDLPGIEVRGVGRYVVAPPSVHPSGAIYRVTDPRASILRVRLAAVLPEMAQTTPIPSKPLAGHGVTVSQILKSWDILQLAESLTTLKSSDGGRGRWYLGLCPFHDDHSPSFWLDTERQRFGCHSPRCVAHRSGDAINLYALAHGVDVATALAMMRRGGR